jgi:hypothetical protein
LDGAALNNAGVRYTNLVSCSTKINPIFKHFYHESKQFVIYRVVEQIRKERYNNLWYLEDNANSFNLVNQVLSHDNKVEPANYLDFLPIIAKNALITIMQILIHLPTPFTLIDKIKGYFFLPSLVKIFTGNLLQLSFFKFSTLNYLSTALSVCLEHRVFTNAERVLMNNKTSLIFAIIDLLIPGSRLMLTLIRYYNRVRIIPTSYTLNQLETHFPKDCKKVLLEGNIRPEVDKNKLNDCDDFDDSNLIFEQFQPLTGKNTFSAVGLKITPYQPFNPDNSAFNLFQSIYSRCVIRKILPDVDHLSVFVNWFQNNIEILYPGLKDSRVGYKFEDVVSKYPLSKQKLFRAGYSDFNKGLLESKHLKKIDVFAKRELLQEDKDVRLIYSLSAATNAIYMSDAKDLTDKLTEICNYNHFIFFANGHTLNLLGKYFHVLENSFIGNVFEFDGSRFDQSQSSLVIRGVHHFLLKHFGASEQTLKCHMDMFVRHISLPKNLGSLKINFSNITGSQFTTVFNQVVNSALMVYVFCVSNNFDVKNFNINKTTSSRLKSYSYDQNHHLAMKLAKDSLFLNNIASVSPNPFFICASGDDSLGKFEKKYKFDPAISKPLGFLLEGDVYETFEGRSFCSKLIVPCTVYDNKLLDWSASYDLTLFPCRIMERITWLMNGKIANNAKKQYMHEKLFALNSLCATNPILRTFFEVYMDKLNYKLTKPQVLFNEFSILEMKHDDRLLVVANVETANFWYNNYDLTNSLLSQFGVYVENILNENKNKLIDSMPPFQPLHYPQYLYNWHELENKNDHVNYFDNHYFQ